MGVEPAFAQNTQGWPLAGMLPLPDEPSDPFFAIPAGSLQKGPREAGETLRLSPGPAELPDRPAEPLGPQPVASGGSQRKLSLAIAASCVFHAAVALFFFYGNGEDVLIAGGEEASVALLGNAPEDQSSAGDNTESETEITNVTLVPIIEPKEVETIPAQAVPVDEARPIEATETESVLAEAAEPVISQPEQAQPAEVAQQPETEQAEPIAEAVPAKAETETTPPEAIPESAPLPAPLVEVPQILATDTTDAVEDDNTVPPLAETNHAVPVETTETVAEATPEPVQELKAEPAPRPVAKKEPVKKVAEAKPLEKPQPDPRKTAEKREQAQKAAKEKAAKAKAEKAEKAAQAKAAKAEQARKKAGSGGNAQADARRGEADGAADGKSSAKSKGAKQNTAAGNAAVSNYPGKIVSKLRRALRYPAAARSQGLRGQVQVSFVVSASGGVGSIRVVSSSGSSILDQAAVDTVRRAAPFPAIPQDAGRSSWPFTVPLAFTR